MNGYQHQEWSYNPVSRYTELHVENSSKCYWTWQKKKRDKRGDFEIILNTELFKVQCIQKQDKLEECNKKLGEDRKNQGYIPPMWRHIIRLSQQITMQDLEESSL